LNLHAGEPCSTSESALRKAAQLVLSYGLLCADNYRTAEIEDL